MAIILVIFIQKWKTCAKWTYCTAHETIYVYAQFFLLSLKPFQIVLHIRSITLKSWYSCCFCSFIIWIHMNSVPFFSHHPLITKGLKDEKTNPFSFVSIVWARYGCNFYSHVYNMYCMKSHFIDIHCYSSYMLIIIAYDDSNLVIYIRFFFIC